MAEEERWQVVGPAPKPLTLEDGTTASIPPGDDPVRIRKDRKFRMARDEGALRRVMVEVDEGEPDGSDDDQGDAEIAEDVIDATDDRDTSILEFGLAENVEDALIEAEIETAGDAIDRGDLTSIEGIGGSRLDDIKDAFESVGLDASGLE